MEMWGELSEPCAALETAVRNGSVHRQRGSTIDELASEKGLHGKRTVRPSGRSVGKWASASRGSMYRQL